MKLIGNEIKKFEYVLDIFKGTCELNNYECIKIPINKGGVLRTCSVESSLDIKKELSSRVFFYGPVFDPDEHVELGAISFKPRSIYRAGEIINLAAKTLFNIGIEDVKIKLSTKLDKEYNEELIENLRAVLVDVEASDVEYASIDELCAFDILVGDKIVGHGGGVEGYSYFKIDYNRLREVFGHDVEILPVEVLIAPQSTKVLSDAFIIGSNLKDAGFKVEVEYDEIPSTKKCDAIYKISFDEKDIASYEVKLLDVQTNEEKVVKIDNIIDEIAFI